MQEMQAAGAAINSIKTAAKVSLKFVSKSAKISVATT